MFNKIWKEQITKPKGKLGIWKPKQELKPREKEEEDKCCEEAKKYIRYFILTKGITNYTGGSADDLQLRNASCKELKDYVEGMHGKVEDFGWPSVSLFWDDCEHEFVEAELWHTKENWIWGEAPREDAWDKV